MLQGLLMALVAYLIASTSMAHAMPAAGRSKRAPPVPNQKSTATLTTTPNPKINGKAPSTSTTVAGMSSVISKATVSTKTSTSAATTSNTLAVSSSPIPSTGSLASYSITVSSSQKSSISTSSTVSSLSTAAISTSYGAVLPAATGIRGVNIGGWLVAEDWMNGDLFSGTGASDQWSFDQTDGAQEALNSHWSTYFTQSDVEQLSSWGINTVRIPIGYWAYNNTGTPYLSGADAYMDKAMGWLRASGIKAIVCVHGSPGSQNGWGHSGHAGAAEWQLGDNMDRNTAILSTIAKKYGGQNYADVVYGIEIVNEPLSWSPLDPLVTQKWVQDTFSVMKSVASNSNLRILASDGFSGAASWSDVDQVLNGDTNAANSPFVLDLHLYQIHDASDLLLTQTQHIAKACGWSTSAFVPGIPSIVGEFSAQTNICWSPDGTITPGSTCASEGCQCTATLDVAQWSQGLINATRQYLEAELDTFEAYSQGYFLWSYKAPGAWGMNNLFQYGVLGPNSITDRVFPKQCSS